MFANIDRRARLRWREKRKELETQLTRDGQRSSLFGKRRFWGAILAYAINFCIRTAGLYSKGYRNARNFEVTEVCLSFHDLPKSFDDYQILHLSDLHLGQIKDLPGMIGDKLSSIKPDLVIITGDFQTFGQPDSNLTVAKLESFFSVITSLDGWLAVLGNHDSFDLPDVFEPLGVRVLVNEAIDIVRGDDILRFVGLDDVHSFFTPDAIKAIEAHQDEFRIALVHTVDMASSAAQYGYKLYLSGHTHGGQICLPGGRPLMTALDSHKHLASGYWQLESMQGYTSRGFGYGHVPARFNCPGEATLITLKRE